MRSFLTALAVCLCAAAASAESPQEIAARRFLTLAYEGDFAALPKTADADTGAFEQSVRNTLRVRCARIDKLDFESVTDDAVRVQVALRKSNRATPAEWMAPEIVPLRLKLARSGEQWLVSAVESTDEEVADLLLAAKPEELPRLLREHLPTKSLARTVYQRAIRVLNYSQKKSAEEVSRDATRTAALARELAILSGDGGGEALALGIDSINAWMQHNEIDRAIRVARESLAIAERVDDPDILARAWYNLGRAIDRHPDAERPPLRTESRASYRNSMHFAERGEDAHILIRVLTMLGLEANAICDHLGARRYADRVLEVARETRDGGGEVDGESLLYSVYSQQSDYDRAEFHHRRAMKLAEKHRSRMHSVLLARSAGILVRRKQYDEARRLYAQAMPRDERGEIIWNSVTPRSNIRAALASIASIEADTGNLAEAECLVAQAGTLPYWLGSHYLRENKPAAALRAALASLAREPESIGTRAAALAAAAHAYRALGQAERAMATIEEAIELRESIAHLIAGDEQQQVRESDGRAGYYALAAELSLERGDAVAALAFLEQSRARVLTNILEHGRPGAMEEAEAANREEQERQRRELARLSTDLDRARVAKDEEAAKRLEQQVADARAVHATFVDGIHSRYERRLATRRGAKADDLRALIRRLPARVAAVEYLVQDRQLYILVARNGEVVHRKIDIERKAVEERVNRLVDMLSRRDLRVRDASRAVYDLLLAPVERDLAGTDTLLVVPDDILWRVPFAALVDERGRFVVEGQAIVYAPSITAYMTMADAKPKTAAARPVSFFAVGNPTLTASATSEMTSFYRDTTLGPLPDAEREVDVVRAFYDPRRTLVLKGKDATEEATKSAVRDATVVHFATHALLDDGHPMYSRLALAPDAAVSDDGWLESWEIARLDLDAEIVILSACETARGTIGGGEGVVGIAWAFFLAGARSTVATQWKIESRSTADLMIAFHRALRADGGDASLHKAHALRESQLALLRDEQYAHPFYWAAFVLLGDPGR